MDLDVRLKVRHLERRTTGRKGASPSLVVRGAVRVIAVSAPQRLPGVFAGVPTWREQGADLVVSNWRGIFGARRMTPAQIAFWENAMQKFMETPEWKAEMELLHGASEYMGSAKTRKFMEQDYAEIKAFLLELELIKK